MPKQKSHRGAAKRFKVTGTGKVLAAHSTRSHKLEKKGPSRKQDLRNTHLLSEQDTRRVKRLLPYNGK